MYIDFFFASKQQHPTTKARAILEMVCDSLSHTMSKCIHLNSTQCTRYWENDKLLALILSAIKTEISIKLKPGYQTRTLR